LENKKNTIGKGFRKLILKKQNEVEQRNSLKRGFRNYVFKKQEEFKEKE